MRKLLLLLLPLLTACGLTTKRQEQQAEQAVQVYLQRQAESCGALYRAGAFETHSFPSGKHGSCYQIRHTYSITVQKGETMQEKASFFVDSLGVAHPY